MYIYRVVKRKIIFEENFNWFWLLKLSWWGCFNNLVELGVMKIFNLLLKCLFLLLLNMWRMIYKLGLVLLWKKYMWSIIKFFFFVEILLLWENWMFFVYFRYLDWLLVDWIFIMVVRCMFLFKNRKFWERC